MNRKRLLLRLSQGALNNVSFSDMRHLVEGFGFRQFLRLVERYNLTLEGD